MPRNTEITPTGARPSSKDAHPGPGLKAIVTPRDGSKKSQPLRTGSGKKQLKVTSAMEDQRPAAKTISPAQISSLAQGRQPFPVDCRMNGKPSCTTSQLVATKAI
jgi:hypothetical protein